MRTRTVTVLLTGFALALVSLIPTSVQAQNEPARPAVQESVAKPIGKIVAAAGAVSIEHTGAVVVQASTGSQAKIGDIVYLGDVVRTGTDGRIGINFSDGSSFNLSSNAHMELTEFVYAPNGKSNSTLFNLSKGTFTFVAGNVAKTGDMKVDTPVATMGIRGTTPHVEISDNGTVRFSTLIEENKYSLAKKPIAPTGRQGEQTTEPRLKICRGC